MHHEDHQIYEILKTTLSQGGRAVLATVIGSSHEAALGAKALYVDGEGLCAATKTLPEAWREAVASRCQDLLETRHQRIVAEALPGAPAVRVAYEPFAPVPRLIIAGGGHIAQPTCDIAAIVGFDVTVIDDRPAYANAERFPRASRVICDDFAAGVAQAGVDDSCAVVVVTRGHRHDLTVLQALKGSRPRYLGVIGSKRRVATVVEKLRELEFDEEFIERIYAPIGLDIGAESPEEIGLAIVAEVVCVLKGGSGGHLAWRPARGRAASEPAPSGPSLA